MGFAGACKCTKIVDFIKNLKEISRLSIQSPLRYQNISCRPISAEIEENLVDAIKNLKQLKELRLVYSCRTQINVLEIIGTHLKYLEELHLNGYQHLFQQKLFDYLEKARYLRVLNIKNTKINLSLGIYREIVRIVANRTNDLPLTIHMTGTGLNHFIDSPFVKVFRVPS